MDTFSPVVRATNWPAVALSAAIPLIVAAGLVYAAVQPQWDEDTGDWAFALLALIPLEFVRALVMTILGDSFEHYRSPRYAVKYFLLSLGILAAMLLGFAAYMLGLHEFIETMTTPHTWALILPVAALIVADGMISLYFFRGDPGCQAARLEAAADDVGNLLGLALYPTPLVLGAGYGILFALKQNGHAFAAWLPDPSVEGLLFRRESRARSVCEHGVVQPRRPAPARRQLGRARADAQAGRARQGSARGAATRRQATQGTGPGRFARLDRAGATGKVAPVVRVTARRGTARPRCAAR
jgi:hypothetical protein